MAPSSRTDGHMNLGYFGSNPTRSGTSTGNSSPGEIQSSSSMKSAFGTPNGLVSAGGSIGSARRTAGSPSHELSARMYSKRAREIQAQEGVGSSIWGPPTSGNSTPLRENIPESPGQDEFPDLMPLPDAGTRLPARRTRADTVPSRFPAAALNGTQTSIVSKTSRPSPSTTPFPSALESTSRTAAPGSGVLSRLRAGSMPQRASVLGTNSPFGPSVFSTNWSSSRDRATTLTSIRSSEGPNSPSQSSISRDGLADADVKTLDYLGLAETPQPVRATLAHPSAGMLMQPQQQQGPSLPSMLADFSMLTRGNRFRSYSVNAKEKYAEDEEEFGLHYSTLPSGTMTPQAAAAAVHLAETQAQIHQHNLAVQAFANHASANRPRARTAGVLDAPPQRSAIRNYLATPSRLDNGINPTDARIPEAGEYDELQEAVQLMHLGALGAQRQSQEATDETNAEGPTRSLWIGSIPVSTTVTSLDAIFARYGKIESTRVLTHKNCGFVNFERLESAVQARSLLNGKEIFPGAGPVRINYAKVLVSPPADTPGDSDTHPSPTPDPTGAASGDAASASGKEEERPDTPKIPELTELIPEMIEIVTEFGTAEEDCPRVKESIKRAIDYKSFRDEIPPIPDSSQERTFDSPRLRDVRKRIENQACSLQEIEDIAQAMLSEILELSSDYLGNTVVQKLFDHCAEDTKLKLLTPIAPHLPDIGVHKNGTWSAQKIIDTAKTHDQMEMIVEGLRPSCVPLFLDPFGNYVLQGCLRFGSPYSDFIFETMLSRMWDIAQGRFGARAMRACLENHHASKDQQRTIAAAIVLHSVQLAVNSNGALLLTWLLDTCNFPRRRAVLAPRLVPHLVRLCTHHVAYLTVLKLVNQRNEPEARDIILKALFFSPNDETLESILKDQASGATLIFKVLTTPFLEESMRPEVIANVAKVLTKLKVSPSQGYKRLMDEVGLSSRNGTREPVPVRESGNGNGGQARQPPRQPAAHLQHNQPYGPQYHPNMPPQSFNSPVPMTRSLSQEPALYQYDQFLGGINPQVGLGGFNGMNNGNYGPDSVNQMQYPSYYPTQSRGMSPQTAFYATMPPNGFGGYPAGSMDAFRGPPNGGPQLPLQANPILQPGQFPVGPQFSPMATPIIGPGQMYNYPPNFYQGPHMPQGMASAGRRGRR